jgi:His-Xaa-Ser system protein HxsD
MSHRQNSVELRFDRAVFALDTVKRALYRLAHMASFDIQADEQDITVILYPTMPVSDEAAETLCARIRQEVLDQDLRDTLSKETANLRNLILANAFSRSGLINS